MDSARPKVSIGLKKSEKLTELKSLVAPGDVEVFDRDLSWLRFNRRVLLEAMDESIPIYERIKFMAIYSSNMDEFFRVRFANIRRIARLSRAGKKKLGMLAGFQDPDELIKVILEVTQEQQEAYGKTYRESIIPSLEKEGVVLYITTHVEEAHKEAVEEYFYSHVLSFIQPIVLDENIIHDVFLENRKLYHAVHLEDKEKSKSIGIVNIPAPPLSRFVKLPSYKGKAYFAFVDDMVRAYVNILFPGYTIKGCYSIKLNRDAELYLENEYSGTLIERIKKNIRNRQIGIPSRFLYDNEMPTWMVNRIKRFLSLHKNDLVPGGRYHNMFDHFSLPNPIGARLEYEKNKPLAHTAFQRHDSVLESMEHEEILLHFPYQRYDYILRYFNEAIISKRIKTIKVALYRVAEDSHVVNALISAARNGKKVMVFIEAKARFDEENNLKWAERMAAVGIDVRFSSLDLKVHAKIALLTGEDEQGNILRYAFMGTGNFNERTASIYADHALLTCDTSLTTELEQTFDFIFGEKLAPELNHLLVAQVNMVERFTAMIDREIAHAENGKKAEIIIKLNNIQDPNIISKLYEAAQKGVKITLIARAICSIKPLYGIRIMRLVDKYLEHARAYWFNNDGQDELYLGSADWMERNLYRRVEVVFPIYNPKLKEEILASLDFQMMDNTKAALIQMDISNLRITEGEPKVRAQVDFYNWLKKKR
ncbi:MAG: polyphosphate kinase 1 [Bacteroidetes bacterium]|nr:polyphosphate kinase 1 [Bacteroidota bacterium]